MTVARAGLVALLASLLGGGALALWACTAHGEGEARPVAAPTTPGAASAPSNQRDQPVHAGDLPAPAADRAPTAGGEDERSYQQMITLVHEGRITPARNEALRFFAQFPDSPLAPAVTRLTGVRPRPRLGPSTTP